MRGENSATAEENAWIDYRSSRSADTASASCRLPTQINCKTHPANQRALISAHMPAISHKNPVYLRHIWRIKPLGLRGYLSRLELLNNKIGYPNILPSANYWAIANFITSAYGIDTTVLHCFYYRSFPTARPDPHNKNPITAKNQKACRFQIHVLLLYSPLYKQIIRSGFTSGNRKVKRIPIYYF